MKSFIPRIALGLLVAFLVVPSIALGQLGATVPNWAAAATYSPARGAITTMGDVTNPLPFIGVTPCRIVDTRLAPGPFGGPSIAGGTSRSFALPVGPCAGLPAAPRAYSLNITSTNAAGPGFFKIWPTGSSEPLVSTLNFNPGHDVANAAIVPAGTGGAIMVKAGVSTSDLVIDINGYYGDTLGNPSDTFTLINNTSQETMFLQNQSTSCSSQCGLEAAVGSGWAVYGASLGTGAGSVGVYGFSAAGVSGSHGVFGRNGSISFLGGFSPGAEGVTGVNSFSGVLGIAQDRAVVGVLLDSVGNDLAEGWSGKSGAAGINYGLVGVTNGNSNGNSGVKGVNGSGEPPGCSDASHRSDGVRGCSDGDTGVTGITSTASSTSIGVRGLRKTAGNTTDAEGYLGWNPSGTAYGVYANVGTIGCSGCVKLFVDPHPYDASKTIHYVSLEGPEAGTYFRGTARTENGRAVIQVPDHFRFVTDEEGMTVQLTAVRAPASLYVESQDLNFIVVRSSRDVTFHYLVQGIRPAYKNFQPVTDGREYVPLEAGAKMPEGWTDWAKQRLIQNGTYNADGTVNMTTAERLGWTKAWVTRESAQPTKSASSPQ